MRRAAKVDESQGRIVSALRAAGARVKVMSHVGGGVPDLLVTYRRVVYLMECKNPGPPSRRRLTTAELEFAREHPVAVVTTPSEALAAIGIAVAA
jgi:hypothetical protein